jgi:hypothetical protein
MRRTVGRSASRSTNIRFVLSDGGCTELPTSKSHSDAIRPDVKKDLMRVHILISL